MPDQLYVFGPLLCCQVFVSSQLCRCLQCIRKVFRQLMLPAAAGPRGGNFKALQVHSICLFADAKTLAYTDHFRVSFFCIFSSYSLAKGQSCTSNNYVLLQLGLLPKAAQNRPSLLGVLLKDKERGKSGAEMFKTTFFTQQ